MEAVRRGSVPAKGNELLLSVSSEKTSMLLGSVTKMGSQGRGTSDSPPGLTASWAHLQSFLALVCPMPQSTLSHSSWLWS